MSLTRSARPSFPALRVTGDRYRTVIHQTHLHVGAEFAGLNRLAQTFGEFATESFVKRNRDVRSRRAGVGWPVPFFRAGEQGELADEQNVATDFLRRAVHCAV